MKISLRENENICLVLGWKHYDVGGMHIIDHVCQRVRMTKCADGAEIKLEYLTVATTIPEQLLTMIKVNNHGARVRIMMYSFCRTCFLDGRTNSLGCIRTTHTINNYSFKILRILVRPLLARLERMRVAAKNEKKSGVKTG